MIVKMYKYTFLVYHKEFKAFLEDLQRLGVVHVSEKKLQPTENLNELNKQLKQIDDVINLLERREIEEEASIIEKGYAEILNDISQKLTELEALEQETIDLKKGLRKAKPWGNFSADTIQKLANNNIQIRLFTSSAKKFQEIADSGHTAEIISEEGNLVYFALFEKGSKTEINADEVEFPQTPYPEINRRIEKTQEKTELINKSLDEYAAGALGMLKIREKEINNTINFENAVLNAKTEAGEKLKILEGWVPGIKKSETSKFLEKNKVLYVAERPTPGDNIPILLKNNRFAKLFESIGSLFSLPSYHELDLTIFFAPFFMLFFGFCLGDAGYGLLFVIGGGLYKLKAKKEVKPYLSLIQLLGLATILFGAISGTLFGINLIEADFNWTEKIREKFLDPDQMFNLSLAIGLVQIVFGLCIKAVNQARQYGFSYALPVIGWLVIIAGSIAYVALTQLEVIAKNKIILYTVLGAGGILVLFFSDPKVNVFSRLGKGIWDVYSTVTGIFGDLLSYIRLFALGLSSAILGFVINDIALQILGASKILGPIFFIIFLLLGHTLNILISSLGSFVHPMRLTFVEFYKNAGFQGGGIEYKPFTRHE